MGSIAELLGKLLEPAVFLLPWFLFLQICFSRIDDDIAKVGQVRPLELGVDSPMTLYKLLGEVQSVTVYRTGLAHFHLLVVRIAHALVLLGEVASKRSWIIKGLTAVFATVL